jgi:hypothetical protein
MGTQHFTIPMISSLMLLKEAIAVYSENHTTRLQRVERK